MRAHSNKTWFAAALLWGVLSAGSALADDTELFVATNNDVTAAQPNILFVVDTSGSMDTLVDTQGTYDPSQTYDGTCASDKVYFSDSGVPSCSSYSYDPWVYQQYWVCAAATSAFTSAGRFTDRMAMYNPDTSWWWYSGESWQNISNRYNDRMVECRTDFGVQGDGTDPSAVYPHNGDNQHPFTNDVSQAISWSNTGRTYTAYTANYLNWYWGPANQKQTRLQIVQDVSTNLLDSISGVNVGLMRFNNQEGGPVMHAMESVSAARDSIKAAINAFTPGGYTPLSETMYEAEQYLAGRAVDYGNSNTGYYYGPYDSVANSRLSTDYNTYKSPLELSCQKNFIVLLTDGQPTRDTSADNKIQSLPGFASDVGATCDTTSGSGDGHCLDDVAEYMNKHDLRPNLPGKQTAQTYTIGFTADFPLLSETAQDGGGKYYLANDTGSLTQVLTNIVTQILDDEVTFTAPTVPVNAFNRTQNLNEVYVTVFKPSGRAEWNGNLKKYQIYNGQLVGQDTATPAVDPNTGFFRDGAQSLWAPTPDGANVTVGGAANQLPPWQNRNLYTNLGGSADLTAASNRVEKANSAIDDAMLNVGGTNDPSRDTLIEWLRGRDALDVDSDGNTDESRLHWGDPLHSRPATVVYGGSPSAPDINDAVVYAATNEGMVHAVDPSTGQELWSFMPQQFLSQAKLFYENGVPPSKLYGVDGNMVVQVNETVAKDGIIEPGESVYLYFGLRRGGSTYYALDITDKNHPKLLWTADGSTVPGLGQTWPTPIPTKLVVDGSGQSSDYQVLVVDGGYDTSQDADGYSQDNVGNTVAILDSTTGQVLWRASVSGADLNLPSMVNSFPADATVIDFDGNGFADRIYAADTGGQLWRFDLFSGQPASSLVTGGVIASLGGAADPSAPVTENRRFYNAPDASLITSDTGQSFVNIAIGSGHRAHPLGVVDNDRFYAIRDYHATSKLTQAQYNAMTPVTDANLVDITDNVDATVPEGSPGWRLELRDGGWHGEKVLAKSVTFGHRIYFTTFTPGHSASNPCSPARGTNKLYVVDVATGKPVTNLDNSVDNTNLTVADRSRELAQGGIAPEVVFLFPSPDDPNCNNAEDCRPPPVACVGLECFDPNMPNKPVLTFWTQDGAD